MRSRPRAIASTSALFARFARFARLACLACFACFALSPSLAHAAGVEVRGAGSKVDVAKLDALVRLELGDREMATNVVVTLAREDRADVVVVRRGESRTGSVVLRGSADAERVIALFVGELARDDGAPPANPSERAAPPEATPPAAAPASAASDGAAGDTQVDVSGVFRPAFAAHMGVRAMGAGGALVFTPHLEGGITMLDFVRLGVIARYGYSTGNDPLGNVSVHAFGGGVTASVRVASGSSRFSLWMGPRAEAGRMFGSGDGVGQRTASSTALSLAWAVEGRMTFGSYDAILGVEGGWIGGGLDLRADDRSVLSLAGSFVGVSAGFGLH